MLKKVKQVAAETMAAYGKNIFSIFLLVILVFLPLNIVRVFWVDSMVDWSSWNALRQNNGALAGVAEENVEALLSHFEVRYLVYMAASGVLTLLGIVANLGIIQLTYAFRKQETVLFSELFVRATSLFWKGIGAELLVGGAIACGLLFFFLPGFYFYFLFFFTLPVVAITGLSGVRAMRVGGLAVRRNWGLVIAFAVTVFLLRFAYLEGSGFLFDLLPLTGLGGDLLSVLHYTLDDFLLSITVVASAVMYLQLAQEEDWVVPDGKKIPTNPPQ